MANSGLLLICLLSCGSLRFTAAAKPSVCPINIVPKLTVDGNEVILYSTEPVHVSATSLISRVHVAPVTMVTAEPFAANTTIVQLRGAGKDGVLLARCEDGASSCSGGPVNLTQYYREDQKEVRLLISMENAASNCKANRTVIFTVGSTFTRGPLIIIHSDVYGEIHWGVPDGIDHVDITCCVNNTHCTRGKITPLVNPTFMALPGLKGDMQFDFYIHDTTGNIRALVGDPYFRITTYEEAPTTVVTVNENIGWIVFLAVTTSVFLTIVIIMSRKLMEKGKKITWFKKAHKRHNNARNAENVDISLVKEAQRDVSATLRLLKSADKAETETPQQGGSATTGGGDSMA